MTIALKSAGAAPNFWVRREWPTVRLWRVAKIRTEKNRPDFPLLSIFLGRGVITYSEGGGQVHKPGQDLSIYQVVRKGDFVLNNQQAWRGSVGVSKHHGIISPAYIVLALPEALNPRFADYLFQSRVMVDQWVTSSKGVGDIQRDVHMPWLKNSKVPLPPREEQDAIVRFLDHVNRRIERYIRAKKKLIALLNEQKQVIIHRAVTRGLDPNVRLKSSGVEWLSEVPEHWEVMPIKRALISMVYGISDSATDEGKIPLLTMGHIQDGNVNVPTGGGVASVDPTLLVERNDLLFNRTNSAELVGKVGLFKGAETAVTFASYLVRMRPRQDNDAEFLNLLLNDRSVLSAARREAIPSLHQANLNPTRYGRLHIAPKLSEQKAIVGFVKDATTQLNTAIARYESEISLVREYSTRLVTDVVTGKLDVREAAAKLPEEPKEEDIEPVEDSADDQADANEFEEVAGSGTIG